MSHKPVVAVAGATGRLGLYVSDILLKPDVRSQFSEVVLLSRSSPSSNEQLAKWETAGATIRPYDNLVKSLSDVDVLINVVGSKGHDLKEELVHALPKTNIKLYFPSEFGVDHTVHDFEQPEWDYKKEHFATARKVAPNIKSCCIFPSLFLETSLGPWFGFSTKNQAYESIGSADVLTSYTAMEDIAWTTTRLAAMEPKDVPEFVHVGGNSVSVREIASVMSKSGGGDIKVTEVDLDEYKSDLVSKSEPDPNPAKYLRFLMGENKMNHSKDALGNDNELVNPGERYWKWKTMSDLAKETKGRPWADF